MQRATREAKHRADYQQMPVSFLKKKKKGQTFNRKLVLVGIIPNQILFLFSPIKIEELTAGCVFSSDPAVSSFQSLSEKRE